ncbi:MAG: TIGR04282 family arsenosugar biosynthesis glycosyltransferase [Flavitalea sp.]
MNNHSAIIIFVRHPELGKVKTRLAATIGNEKALEVYNILLKHTFDVVQNIRVPVYVFYADRLPLADIWKGDNILKRNQKGNNLGERMHNAFKEVFELGHSKAVIIGSDCYELSSKILTESLEHLDETNLVIGPARDGGYYLLGMNAPLKNVFEIIEWSTPAVFSSTIKIIRENKWTITELPVLTDVDTESDITFNY